MYEMIKHTWVGELVDSLSKLRGLLENKQKNSRSKLKSLLGISK